jgi:hypothetical protein
MSASHLSSSDTVVKDIRTDSCVDVTPNASEILIVDDHPIVCLGLAEPLALSIDSAMKPEYEGLEFNLKLSNPQHYLGSGIVLTRAPRGGDQMSNTQLNKGILVLAVNCNI